MELVARENLPLLQVNNKGADQTAQSGQRHCNSLSGK